MRTVICAPGHRQAVTEARSHGVAPDDMIMASGVHRLRGLLGFSVLVVEGFTSRRDAVEVWQVLRHRAECSRSGPVGGPVLPFCPPPFTVLYRADVAPAAVEALARLLDPFATGNPPMVPLAAAAAVAGDLIERHTIRNASMAGGGDGTPEPRAVSP
ncbi:hypothetical protein [Actinomadura violacea]|uniref:Uncharacterized protein n=1 Tax=Actinomadura violacea TaxID=2819934 RepID=A0ABS3RYS0_9ACTN|nr:hypothetical protein [Actinomadura violacea]MBO2461155.1 hypothetical protein [Actinomadura violacea]